MLNLIHNIKSNSKYIVFVLCTCLLLIMPENLLAQKGTHSATMAALEVNDARNQAKVARALEKLLKSMQKEPFTYQIKNRPDPFMPFVTLEITQEVGASERLTGMRKFEPGQLSLVAIVFSDANPIAMVEDSAGKGYIIKRGTKIGRSGVVANIIPNEVIIKQLTSSLTKKKSYKTIQMVLRKEGEKL